MRTGALDPPDSFPPRPLSVGILAPPWLPVPPPTYGGTELVVDQLARGLARDGHQVRLFATGDSTCPVPVQRVYDRHLGTTVGLLPEVRQALHGRRALAGTGVIHDHTLLGPLLPPDVPGPPVVTTVHAGLSPEVVDVYRALPRDVTVVAISAAQAAQLRAAGARVDRVIHHGVDVDALRPGPGTGGYALFLGRMSAVKGVDQAIRVARTARVPLVISAKMWEPVEHRYFTEVVEPMLGPDARFVGEVGGSDKTELLGGAVALLNPIRWPEPFGLVMAEALACGTPVLSFGAGSAPEIVRHGVTGFVCKDEDDMTAALRMVGHLDRRACRRDAVERFSTRRMVSDYVDLYRSVADRRGVTVPA